MEVVEITENCFIFIMSLSGHKLKDNCIYDYNGNITAFKRFIGNSVKFYGLIEKKNKEFAYV